MFSRDDYVNALKKDLIDLLTDGIMKWLLSKFTFISWGPLSALTSFTIEFIIEKGVKYGEIGVFFLHTDLRVSAQGRNYYAALESDFYAQKYGSEHDKKEARRVRINSFRELIKLTN